MFHFGTCGISGARYSRELSELSEISFDSPPAQDEAECIIATKFSDGSDDPGIPPISVEVLAEPVITMERKNTAPGPDDVPGVQSVCQSFLRILNGA